MTDTRITHSKDIVRIDGETIEMDYPVEKAIVHEGVVVVLVEPPVGTDVRDNVAAFDMSGELLWTITPASTEDVETPPVYTDIFEADGSLLAHNWNGGTYEIEMETGEVEYSGWSK